MDYWTHLNQSYEVCKSCLLLKKVKSPFTRHGERVSDLLGLIHSYIYGPISTSARRGYDYSITLLMI